MNIRDRYTKILKDSSDRAGAARKTITEILRDYGYTASGKKTRVTTITNDLDVYLAEQRQTINDLAERVIRDVEALFEVEQRQRNEDTGYQTRLASLLTLIPAVAEYGSMASLKQRILPFSEDPVACSAIESVLRKTASELRDRSKVMSVLSCIPVADGVEKRTEQLRKIQATMQRHLDNMSISVADPAYTTNNERTIYQSVTGGGSVITSTLNYLNSASSDLTSFDEKKLYENDGREKPITFDFNYVNE